MRSAQVLRPPEARARVVPVGRAVLDASVPRYAALSRRGLRLPGGIAVDVTSDQPCSTCAR